METMKSNFEALLICAVALVLINCKKDNTETQTPIWNYSTFTDARDGHTYKYIKIGTQEWMAENLNYKTATGSWYSWESETEGAKYGRLYTLEAAKQALPAGWHLPTDAEWKQLEMTLGMSQNEADAINSRGTTEGSKLKAASGWNDNENKTSGNGTDAVGFTALPGGMRTNSGNYFVNGWYGYWWTSTEINNSMAWLRYITYERTQVYRNQSFKEDAYSVRCVKN